MEIKKEVKRSRKSEILSWVYTILIAVVVALCIRFFVIEFVAVDGPSMRNTLQTGEWMLVTKLDYTFGTPQRGDIVVCQFPQEQKFLVKRIIGLPGETIEAKGGKLYINGQEADNKYATVTPDDPAVDLSDPVQPDFEKVVIPNDCVFVMGDNRRDSSDSRDYGPMPIKNILSVPHFVIYPFDKMKAIGR